MLTSAGLPAYGLAKSRSTSCFSTSVLRARRSCSSVSWRCPSSSAIAISARPMTSLARTSSLRQTWTSSRRPLDSWASRWARGGSCQMLGSASSRCSASRRWLLSGRSKMLLELQDLLQKVVRLVEDLFHGLVSVTVLESLAAAAGTDVVAPDAGEIQRWRPADDSDRSQRPIVLVTDRPRFLIGGIPAVAALFVAVVLLLARVPVGVGFLFLIISIAAGLYARGGKSGYYDVAQDGSLGHFYGRRVPAGLSAMRRTKP